jgi:hypothetical protein
MSRRQVLAFFRRYRTAFDRLDGDAVAALWHAPSAIADTAPGSSHARVTAWADARAMRDNMLALCGLYRDNGYHRAEFELTGHLPLGRDQAFALLNWTLLRRDASVLNSFATGYHLVRGESGVRVLTAAAYQENIGKVKKGAHAAQ